MSRSLSAAVISRSVETRCAIPGLDRVLQVVRELLPDHVRTSAAPASPAGARQYSAPRPAGKAAPRPARPCVRADSPPLGPGLTSAPPGPRLRCIRSGFADDHSRRPLGPGARRRAGDRAEAHRLHRARRRADLLRPRLRRAGHRGRRALLQHRDDRLPGDHDRSLLRRADRHLHLPAHRQRRRERRGRRDRRALRRRHGGEVGPDRARELARRRRPRRLARPPRADRGRRRRHPAADPGDPAAGRAARRDLPRPRGRLRPRRPPRAGARLPRARRHGPRRAT